MSEPDEQTEHAAKFRQVCVNMSRLANTLCTQYPEFPPGDFGRAFLATGLGLLLPAVGDLGAANYLRTLADAVESGESPTAH